MILGAIIRARVSESRTVSENEEIVRGCVCARVYAECTLMDWKRRGAFFQRVIQRRRIPRFCPSNCGGAVERSG